MRQSSLAAFLPQGHPRPFLAEEEGVKPTLPEELCGGSHISLESQSTQKHGSFSKSGVLPEPQEALSDAGCGAQHTGSHLSTEVSAFCTVARFLYLLHGTFCTGCEISRNGAWESTPECLFTWAGRLSTTWRFSFYVSEPSTDMLWLQAAFQKPLPALPACLRWRACKGAWCVCVCVTA